MPKTCYGLVHGYVSSIENSVLLTLQTEDGVRNLPKLSIVVTQTADLRSALKCTLTTLADAFYILLQTWKVASQQCESYGWEESFTGISMG
ncbi:hypothetical protein AVEN_76956-1 [Araneus ventricosus]|uniref:Uncharacterized protein n=1 Tax=Araneus ventricosus TaxID=182803 RepID=A0A4Y2WMG1_ARAVE|nr:hypothetical protein AVEN_76956-1 [Araneus ventricosus]